MGMKNIVEPLFQTTRLVLSLHSHLNIVPTPSFTPLLHCRHSDREEDSSLSRYYFYYFYLNIMYIVLNRSSIIFMNECPLPFTYELSVVQGVSLDAVLTARLFLLSSHDEPTEIISDLAPCQILNATLMHCLSPALVSSEQVR